MEDLWIKFFVMALTLFHIFFRTMMEQIFQIEEGQEDQLWDFHR